LFHEWGTKVLWCILLHVGKSTTQPDAIARSLLEIMDYPDRLSRAQCLKEAMYVYDLYSLHTLPEELGIWESVARDVATASDSELDSDDSGYVGDCGSDVHERCEGTCGV
jgi:hypothetical protein